MTRYALPALDVHDIGVDDPMPEEWLDTLHELSVKLGNLQYKRAMARLNDDNAAYLAGADEEAHLYAGIDQARAAILDALRRAEGDA